MLRRVFCFLFALLLLGVAADASTLDEGDRRSLCEARLNDPEIQRHLKYEDLDLKDVVSKNTKISAPWAFILFLSAMALMLFVVSGALTFLGWKCELPGSYLEIYVNGHSEDVQELVNNT
ncbi:hypothetical protein QR680_005675 [Steinernema hermaphroditum]|uniref:Uncharacterized protein n=1 Tax=Steinernema hermaphroditum TaxID=289476 RepID=A0AA39LVV5_9BILA|nr:hypothetical protein QR680_005675 [Steinernema hermaphroditum]